MNITPFVDGLKKVLEEYRVRNGFTYFTSTNIVVTEGKKFFKVLKQEVLRDGDLGSATIVCFIDKTTGDIFKPASWNAPAKHVRGNVLSAQNGMEAINQNGHVVYLRE